MIDDGTSLTELGCGGRPDTAAEPRTTLNIVMMTLKPKTVPIWTGHTGQWACLEMCIDFLGSFGFI